MPLAAAARRTSGLVAAGVHTKTRSAWPSGRSSMPGTVSMPSTGDASRLVAKTRPGVAVGQDVVQGDEAELAGVGRGAGDDDAGRVEQGPELLGAELGRGGHRPTSTGSRTSTRASTAIGTPSTTISGLTSAETSSGVAMAAAGQAEQHVGEPLAVDRRLAPEGAEQRLGAQLVDHLLGVDPLDRAPGGWPRRPAPR